MEDSGTTMTSASSSRKRKSSSGPPRVVVESARPPHPTLESLLGVPLEMIFRQIPSTGSSAAAGKPLLTRAEARCLLRIAMLASEMDQLVQVSNQALQQRIACRSFGQKILHPPGNNNNNNKSHPYLRPLIPLLSLQGSVLTTRTLQSVEGEMHRVLTDLQQCSRSLRQFSEHNWTLSESLFDTLGEDYSDINVVESNKKLPKGAILAVEKRRLSDLEEELCNRIDSFTGQQQQNEDVAAEDEDDVGGEDETEQEGRKGKALDMMNATSMAEVCTRLWSGQTSSDKKDNVMDCDENNEQQPQDQEQSQQQQKVGLFSYPETIQGLDQRLMEGNEPPQSTPMAVDDQSKPQGIPHSSANMEEEEEDDDDATVLNNDDAQQVSSRKGKLNDNSQQSTHSVVSKESDEGKEIPKQAQAPTQSQVQKHDAAEALAFLQG